MYVLPPTATTDVYTEFSGAYLETPDAYQVNIIVENAPVYMQYAMHNGLSPGGSVFGLEVKKTIGKEYLNRPIQRVRFRSATPGRPAIVSVEALT